MQATPTKHLSPDIFRVLAAGQLDAAASAAILTHLEGCVECRQAGVALIGSGFVERLRAARSPAGTVAEAQTPAGTGHAVPSPLQPATTPCLTPDLLPELRDHPHYEVIRELGRGGMGVIYLVRNKLMDRPEVLKVVNKQQLGDAQSAERFLREIRAAARLSHANIVTAYSALQVGELLAFAMEYVEGEDLEKVVRTQGRLPVANACYYTMQVAQGLQDASEKGLVHRDIKPQNLILARVGKKHRVKILDFGLAKAKREGEETNRGLTGTGMMMGTPDYIAPEQTLDAAKADIRADIYSLGCSLYYLLTGSPPFTAKSQYEVLQAHQLKEATPLDQVRNDVPVELAAIVARMMAKDPAKRYQQPVEVAQALAPFVKAGPKAVPAAPVSPLPVVPAKTVIENDRSSALAGKQPTGPAPAFEGTVIEGGSTVNRATTQAAHSGQASFLQRPEHDDEASKPVSAKSKVVLFVSLAVGSVVVLGIVAVVVAGAIFLGSRGHDSYSPDKPGGSGPGGSTAAQGSTPDVSAQLAGIDDVVSPEQDFLMAGDRFVHWQGGPRVVLTNVGNVRIFHLGSGKALTPLLKHADYVTHTEFSPDGKLLLTTCKDGTVRLWDSGTLATICPPIRHTDEVWYAAFSPDGKRLVTASKDGTARVWDTATGQAVSPPLEHDGGQVYKALFSPDGKRVVTAGFDRTARI